MTEHSDLVDLIANAVERANAPLRARIDKLQADSERAVANARDDADRAARIAGEDRERLALKVQEDSKRYAATVAEDVINSLMKSLGLDPERPSAFVQDMMFLKELRETFGTAKKHAITVFVGLLMMAIATGLWASFKTGTIK